MAWATKLLVALIVRKQLTNSICLNNILSGKPVARTFHGDKQTSKNDDAGFFME